MKGHSITDLNDDWQIWKYIETTERNRKWLSAYKMEISGFYWWQIADIDRLISKSTVERLREGFKRN